MPELPEVETIVRSLRGNGVSGNGSLPGQRVTGARIFWDRSIANPAPEIFKSELMGQIIHTVNRRGKFIVVSLDHQTLLVHLRMSGDLRLEFPNNGGQDIPQQPHDRVIIQLDGGKNLVFNDPRKFGRMWLVAEPQIVTGRLGPEPLDPSFTSEQFFQHLQRKHRQIKPLLLDQSFLAGLGNIYTDEALHCAGIHPARLSDGLIQPEADRLWNCIRDTLESAINRQGSSIDWMYRGGSFQDLVQVYHRTGHPCLTCGTIIQRIIIGQRSTHYCPNCQHP